MLTTESRPGSSAASTGSSFRACSSSRVTVHCSNRKAGRRRSCLDEPLCGGRERGAVGGGQRLRVPARHRQAHVGPLVHRAQHPPDEGGVQERHVGGADEGHVRAVLPGRPARRPGPAPGPCPPADRRLPRRPAAGRAGPGREARTTTTGPPVARARMPTVRRSSVDPCHSSAALGVPIRDDRPPASTTPAESRHALMLVVGFSTVWRPGPGWRQRPRLACRGCLAARR